MIWLAHCGQPQDVYIRNFEIKDETEENDKQMKREENRVYRIMREP